MTSALVLGGGGVTGVAWETGLVFGLLEGGVDLTTATLVVGTSAGAAVAAQVTSGVPASELFARQLRPSSELNASLGWRTLGRYALAMLFERDPLRFRQRLGRVALGATTVDEAARRAVIASRLPSQVWPQRDLRLTAVDARSGEFRVFDQASGVSLLDAVSASCAVPGVWPTVRIGNERYMDGGMRSAANADLALGFDRVVVVAPMPGGFGPMTSVAQQVALLRAKGARVTVVSPDAEARRVMGRNSLDPSKRPVSAQAGRRQAAMVLAAVREVWATT
jgi:NTE family protein